MSLAHRRYTVEAILREAGKRALEHFKARTFSVEEKGIQDFVSEVDRQTEVFIRDRLNSLFPDDAILGEEGGGQMAARTWIIDPIDGTTNFIRGIPFWCLSAGLVVDGRPSVGVIYDPCQDEMFSAHDGGGATLNGELVRVSTTASPSHALLSIGYSFKSPPTLHNAVIAELFAAGSMYRMHGAGALALAQVACGRVDGFWEAIIYPWDVAAGLALVREAGGVVSDYFARETLAGKEILAATPSMADFYSSLVRSVG